MQASRLASLLAQKPDDTIEIDLDLDELDATSAEPKATYQEIKDYMLKEFGLKVSNLYISQIKRKCGIEVGENYNLPKTENPKVPQCPKEKEDAIKADIKIIYDKQSIGFQGTQKTVMSLKPFLFADFWWIINKIHVSNVLMKITCIFYI